MKHKKFLIPVFILAAAAGFGLITMLIWNEIVPTLFHLPEITFVQAVLLLILTRLLFGFGGHRPGRHHPSFRDKFRNMSPEEQEKFKKKWSHLRTEHWHCSPTPPTGESTGKSE